MNDLTKLRKVALIGIVFKVPEKVENYCLFQDIAVTIKKR
jgi:hypothetical protein